MGHQHVVRGSSGRCERTSPTQAHAKRNAEYSRVSTRFLRRSEGIEAANIDKYWAMLGGKHGNRAGLNCTATVADRFRTFEIIVQILRKVTAFMVAISMYLYVWYSQYGCL